MVGRKRPEEDARLASVLFNKKKYQILGFLLDNPDEQFSIKDIKDATEVSRPVISDLVEALSKIGLLDREKKGNLYLIEVNRYSPYYRSLKSILKVDSKPLKHAAHKAADRIMEIGKDLESHIVSIYLFGSVAREMPRLDSDVDLLVVEDGDMIPEQRDAVEHIANQHGENLNVDFSITWYTEEEFRDNLVEGVALVKRILEEGKKLAGKALEELKPGGEG